MRSEKPLPQDDLDRAIRLIQDSAPPRDGFLEAVKTFRAPRQRPRRSFTQVGIALVAVAAVLAIAFFVERRRPDRDFEANRKAPTTSPLAQENALTTEEGQSPARENNSNLTANVTPTKSLPADSLPEPSSETEVSVTEQAQKVVAFVNQNCVSCHDSESYKGGIVFEKFKDAASIREDRTLWESALIMVQQETMPPPDESPELSKRERDEFLHATDFVLNWIDPQYPKSGYVTMRRLNRLEYCNSVFDMLRIHYQPGADFPPDEIRWGFDNNGEILALTPALEEKYLAATEAILHETFALTEHSEFQKTMLAYDLDNNPRKAARTFILHLASQAFRRPATAEEVDHYVELYDRAATGGSEWDQAFRPVLQELLMSPKFLYRADLDNRAETAQNRKIDEYQLAARLSFFLWSNSPDTELMELASRGQLSQNIETQVRRMLKSDNSRALTENFALQWLKLRKPIYLAVDRKKFPEYTDELRESMVGETLNFFDEIRSKDRSILDFIDGKFTYLNQSLAEYYGIADTKGNEIDQIERVPNGVAIRGDDFVRVELQSKYRSGVLTHASVLTASSYPGRTSPVNRGRFVLDRFFNTPTPPPPAPPIKIPPLEDQGVTTGSIRQLMDRHAEDSFCAACHTKMDAIGFTLENFDALGRFRTRDGGFEIDASGTMPNGRFLSGPDDLKNMLREERDIFAGALAEKLLVYSLGRRMQYYDKPAIKKLVSAVSADDYRFSTLIVEIVKSEPFQMRHAHGSTKPVAK